MPIRPEFRHFYQGPAWQATRARIRERAGNRCERCHARNHTIGYRSSRTGEFVEHTGPPFPPPNQPNAQLILIQCGCAHLNNVPGDDRDENLAWLCRGCHLAHDFDHHTFSRMEHKDARRPLLQEARA